MAKKVFKYRGYEIEDLQKMSEDDFVKLLKSRDRRKVERGLSEQEKILLEKIKEKNFVRTHCRDMIIFPSFVGKKVAIHNGSEFQVVEIQPEMIGHRLGEFALTRKDIKHSAPGVGATRSSKYIPLK